MIHDLTLLHYSKDPFELDRNYIYDQNTYNYHAKPVGLWFSIEGEYDWNWWCRGEDFRVEYLAFQHKIKLKKDANIVCLTDAEMLRYFSKKYKMVTRFWDESEDTYQLHWDEVKKVYQGIIIPKYLWECRMALETCWYYGWDCASGCIWDLECIESFELIKETTNV